MTTTEQSIAYRQTFVGNCGLYALANLLNDERFIADITPGIGQNTFELNKQLELYYPEVYLSQDYFIPQGFGRITDPEAFSVKENHNSANILMLLVVDLGKYMHCLGALMSLTDERPLFLVDSLKANVQQTTVAEFLQQYTVLGIQHFRLVETSEAAAWSTPYFDELIANNLQPVTDAR